MSELVSPADLERRNRLRRMKAFATGLFVLMAVLFVVAWRWEQSAPAWGYLRAAAEAGMVGALADWFAVTALFRHPLGLPIPHTAIIPRRKAAIGSALSDFVATNFLSEEVVRTKISNAGVTRQLAEMLSDDDRAERLARELAVALRGVVSVLSDEDVIAVLSNAARGAVSRVDVGPLAGRVLAEVVGGGSHRPLVDMIVERCRDWVAGNEQAIVGVVRGRAPGWTPRTIDGMVARRIYREVAAFVVAVHADQQHPLRVALDGFLAQFAQDLQRDPHLRARANRLTAGLMASGPVQSAAAAAWGAVKSLLGSAAGARGDDPAAQRHRGSAVISGEAEGRDAADAGVRVALAKAITHAGRQLAHDPALTARLDGYLADAAGYVAAHHARRLTGIIDETIERWDGPRTARLIELHIGKDLQFIRINGTVVGALAGLAIYAIAQLVLG